MYNGLTLDKIPEQVESGIVIDFELAFTHMKVEKPLFGIRDKVVVDDTNELEDVRSFSSICERPGCCGNDITFHDYQVDEIERDQFMKAHEYLIDDIWESSDQLSLEHIILLPPYVYGFVLRSRRWATFDIEFVNEIPYSDEGWKNLVIKKYMKDIIIALVQNHERQWGSQTMAQGALPSVDLVQGKGQGLTILLHGPPGVGKTSTAECVAALTGRPLLPITCGDLGHTAEAVEGNLENSFRLAHKWGCVLLFDEADVFISQRKVDDVQRNAIVSVFLRSLEYYRGILFLTTNRVGKLDRAFKSRIHLSLLYKGLNRKRTLQVWKNNLERVEKEFNTKGEGIICRHREILEFAEGQYMEKKDSDDGLSTWNGRQIRNAFQTAIAIAMYDASQEPGNVVPILDASQFDKVARTSNEFEYYLDQVTSYTDDQLARVEMERNDRYTSIKARTALNQGAFDLKDGKKVWKKRKNGRRNRSDIEFEDSEEDSEDSPDKDSGDSSHSSEGQSTKKKRRER
ncbi:P-loop containing nucleoside triphosphate hydrolase protein [Xylaria bambusicola]|uniref:P-loop containing nucleoside triphosphate hydrolase protein n=1 Tax=Xylaria bambusicola TaxID=326684 RepID=UPI002008BDEA|nr:P-loop containing nucleoside triphosphate hydrolase protein [Xylaria bambusicola]KAI0508429.1 P-loop containing nucleoside triphosphate hydrolase protein [Xylaria bambusicola]